MEFVRFKVPPETPLFRCGLWALQSGDLCILMLGEFDGDWTKQVPHADPPMSPQSWLSKSRGEYTQGRAPKGAGILKGGKQWIFPVRSPAFPGNLTPVGFPMQIRDDAIEAFGAVSLLLPAAAAAPEAAAAAAAAEAEAEAEAADAAATEEAAARAAEATAGAASARLTEATAAEATTAEQQQQQQQQPAAAAAAAAAGQQQQLLQIALTASGFRSNSRSSISTINRSNSSRSNDSRTTATTTTTSSSSSSSSRTAAAAAADRVDSFRFS
ncbi:zinc carboxypeptidase, putative [Eimeria praecox]|uniref:Zinc carboxypeptidase, putative n=1 Tax=Eimeria praecox TaxID=51316 RepID=U6H0X3_9EIME|nr:zinc carboxypeptidase, putative [Eimeria praecox]